MSKVQQLSATVSSKGQVAIPADVRRRLGLVRGSVVRFVLDSEGVRLLPTTSDVRRLKGRLARPEAPVNGRRHEPCYCRPTRTHRHRPETAIALDTNVLVRYLA